MIAPRLVLIHPAGYNRTTRGGDLALIQLSETLTDIEPLEYRRSSDEQALPHSGRIMGWGRTSAEEQPNSPRMSNLQVADVPIHNFEDSILIEYGFSEILPEFIPTGQISPPKGASQGDSGGPLLVRGSGNGEWILAGVDSWGKSFTSEAAAISMFTNVAFFSDWIDSIVDANPWNDLPDPNGPFGERGSLEFGGDDLPGLKFWPFSSGPILNLEFSSDLVSWQPFQFSMERAADLRFGNDGSLSYLPSKLFHRPRTLFIRETRTEDEVVRSGLFPLQPYQDARGISLPVASSFGQEQVVYRLVGFEPERTYAIDFSEGSGVSRYLTLHKRHEGQLQTLYSATLSEHGDPIKFTVEDAADYWLSVGRLEGWGSEFRVYAKELNLTLISESGWQEGILEESDTAYRRPGIVMDAYKLDPSFSGDIRIELESVFDAEMGAYESKSGVLLGYYDQGWEGELETFIVHSEHLRDGDFRIFNFDKGIYGTYRFRLTTRTESGIVSVGVDEQRAITLEDESMSDDDGSRQYYEWIEIEDAGLHYSITVTVEGHGDFAPAVGLYSIDDQAYLDHDQGHYVSLTFSPEPDKHCDFYVASWDGRLNQNYRLEISGYLRDDPTDPTDPTDPGDF